MNFCGVIAKSVSGQMHSSELSAQQLARAEGRGRHGGQDAGVEHKTHTISIRSGAGAVAGASGGYASHSDG